MDNSVQQCLNLIIFDNVDEVLWALNDTYFWFLNQSFIDEDPKKLNVLQRFLDQISINLAQKEGQRQIATDQDARFTFRQKTVIGKIIQTFLEKLTREEGIDFLGKLTAEYALAVPEPLFRVAKTFAGLHKTPDIPSVDDTLPMTDEMILFGWQYFWFYTWLGY